MNPRLNKKLALSVISVSFLTSCSILPLTMRFNNDDEDPIAQAAEPFAENTERTTADQIAYHLSSLDRGKPQALKIGMSMRDVKSVWGEPHSQDSECDPLLGNEKWTYSTGISSRYGLGSRRVVYFEKGLVAGWEN